MHLVDLIRDRAPPPAPAVPLAEATQ